MKTPPSLPPEDLEIINEIFKRAGASGYTSTRLYEMLDKMVENGFLTKILRGDNWVDGEIKFTDAGRDILAAFKMTDLAIGSTNHVDKIILWLYLTTLLRPK
jgi:hypothetical protein